MTLEDIVPPLEICKQIPKGKFADSALIWFFDGSQWWVNAREFDATSEIECSAPTLEEILLKLINIQKTLNVAVWWDHSFEWNVQILSGKKGKSMRDENPSALTAALKLWLEVNKPDMPDRIECKTCHGTGYLKSHSDEPDRPCPYCGYTMPEDGEDD